MKHSILHYPEFKDEKNGYGTNKDAPNSLKKRSRNEGIKHLKENSSIRAHNNENI